MGRTKSPKTAATERADRGYGYSDARGTCKDSGCADFRGDSSDRDGFFDRKATEIKYSINSTMRQNAALQKEIDVLEVKIGSANSIESIEQYATEKLGMRYPKAGQSIYLTIDRAANKDLVQRIKEKAYRE